VNQADKRTIQSMRGITGTGLAQICPAFMATVRDVPYLAGKVVTVRSWHNPQLNPLKCYFHPQ